MLRLIAATLVCLLVVSAKRVVNGTRCSKNQVISRLTVFEDGTLEAECGPVPCGEVGRRCIEDQTSCRADTDIFSGMRWAPNGQRAPLVQIEDGEILMYNAGPRNSVLLRCCTIKVPNKIYVGTDLVTAGSYYEGGPIAKKDMYYPKGREFDFIANVRTEQGGVRVWVYRVACGDNDQRVDFEPVLAQTPLVPTRPAAQTEVTDDQKQKVVSEPQNNEEEAEEEEGEDEEGEEEEEEEVTKPPVEFNPLRYRPPNVQRSSTGVKNA